MNKQELIDKLKRHFTVMSEIEGSEYDKGYKWATKQHLVMIADLDEPEKPVVPQYVADWYEENKDGFEYNLYSLCIDFHERKLHEDLHEWFTNNKNKPIEVLVLMNKYGYEVEKEKLYTVEIPNPHGLGHTVLVKDMYGNIFITYVMNSDWRKSKVSQLTEAEIKKDFDWAWRFAKGVTE